MNILKILTPQRKIGNLGEQKAVKHLKKNGYKILETNYTALGAEIDIIAKKGDLTAFVEVKTRNIKNLGFRESRPGASVTPEKQRKIIKAASYYTAHKAITGRKRFDVIEVYTDVNRGKTIVTEIKHLEGCFDKNSAYDAGYYFQQKKEGSVL